MRNKALAATVVALALCAGAAQPRAATPDRAAYASFVKEASAMLVLDNGRLKPLSVYARFTLADFSGRATLHGAPAIFWLCDLLTARPRVDSEAVFLMSSPDAADAINIAPVKSRRYSLRDLAPGLAKLDAEARMAAMEDPRDRPRVESELLRVALAIQRYNDLSGALIAPEAASPGLAILPLDSAGGLAWTGPGSALTDTTAALDSIGRLLAGVIHACGADDYAAAAALLRKYNAAVLHRCAGHGMHPRVGLELLYTALDPFVTACVAYFAALLILATASLVAARKRAAVTAGALLLAAGFIVHTAGLCMRAIIMQRPPIATFYETFVFVAWAGVALGMIGERLWKNGFGLPLAAFMGAIFLFVAGGYGSEGDTMGMLAPILNSNFRLAAHIITISLGYAGCLAAGIAAHLALARQAFTARRVKPPDGALDRAVRSLLAAGATFTVIGTVLGGMWAQTAWGRFWGWDPKENGALVIILWCAMVMLARASGFIKATGTALCASIGVPVVMLAWIGVNLLGIGMHAYGFTALGAKILIAVCGVEVVFLGVVVERLKH